MLVLVVAATDADAFEAGLRELGYHAVADGHRVSAAVPDELAFGGARPLRGRLRLPGDKSISHRALLFAALADGREHDHESRDRRRRARDARGRSTQLGVGDRAPTATR